MTDTIDGNYGLSDYQKQEFIEQYRDINVEHDYWYEGVYEQFIQEVKALGFALTSREIQFTGFWSQGDGASFTLDWHDVPQAVHSLGWQDRYPWLAEHCKDVEVYFAVKRSVNHRYVHQYTMSVETSQTEGDSGEDAPFKRFLWETHTKEVTKELELFEYEIKEFMQGRAADLYRRLEAEYEYLTSDECVWDAIEAKQLHMEIADETDV